MGGPLTILIEQLGTLSRTGIDSKQKWLYRKSNLITRTKANIGKPKF